MLWRLRFSTDVVLEKPWSLSFERAQLRTERGGEISPLILYCYGNSEPPNFGACKSSIRLNCVELLAIMP